jgi:hypothetical protein
MASVEDDLGPETAVRPPARKPGSVPSTAQQPLVDDRAVEPWPVDPQLTQTRPVQPTQAVPAAPAAQPPPQPRPAPAPRPAGAPAPQVEVGRRYRQTIHRVDLWSVLKISVCFYICGMAVTMVALVALWLIADAAGVIHSVEKFFGDLLQTKDFTFLDGEILRGALLVSAVLVVLLIVITVIAAAFYNVFAELFGGVEITISEDETAV